MKKHRSRVNSQKTRIRERGQMDQLQSQQTCLYLTNSALHYQNQHMRDAIMKIRGIMSSQTAVIPSHAGMDRTRGDSLQPLVHLPTSPMIAPQNPQSSALQQQLVNLILANLGTQQRPQLDPPDGNMAPQVALALQQELTKNPVLSAALNAGLLQLALPGAGTPSVATHQVNQPPPIPPLQNTTVPSIQHLVDELLRTQGSGLSVSARQTRPSDSQ